MYVVHSLFRRRYAYFPHTLSRSLLAIRLERDPSSFLTFLRGFFVTIVVFSIVLFYGALFSFGYNIRAYHDTLDVSSFFLAEFTFFFFHHHLASLLIFSLSQSLTRHCALSERSRWLTIVRECSVFLFEISDA